MKLIYLLLLLVSFNSWSQLLSEEEVSLVMKNDSQQEVKKALLNAAILKAASNLTAKLGFDTQEYNKKLNEKFEKFFERFKVQKLLKSFGKDYASTLSQAQREEFLLSLEQYREKEFQDFHQLHKMIQAYSFKSFTSAADDTWKALIEVQLDKVKLERHFKKIVRDEAAPYSKIWIVSEVDLMNMSWKELDLERSDVFVNPLLSSWSKWFNDNLPSVVEEAGECDQSCQAFFKKWEGHHQEESLSLLPPEFLNGVWVRILYDLKKVSSNTVLNENKFLWDTKVLIIDINTKRTLKSFKVGTSTKTFKKKNQKDLNSALASAMFRSSLSALKQVSYVLASEKVLNQMAKLEIKGHKTLQDAFAFMGYLKAKGSPINLEVKLDSFQKDKAQFICFYQGEEKSFSDLLSSLKEVKSTHHYSLVNESTGTNYLMNLVID